jgi:hypothetical protein
MSEENELIGAILVVLAGLAVILVAIVALAGPWWGLLAIGIVLTVMGLYSVGKVLK